MSESTLTRNEEIRQIHRDYANFYTLFGGIVLVLIGIAIGAVLFSGDSGYGTNLYTEAISVGLTIFVLNVLQERRDKKNRLIELQEELVRQAGSRSHDTAVSAIDMLRKRGWLLRALKKDDEVLLKGANLSHANLAGANLQIADLIGADLSHANLEGTNLVRAELAGANLSVANLQEAHLYDAKLINANLASANLKGAVLRIAKLSGANITGTQLSGADLSFANLEGAYLLESYLRNTKLKSANLVNANLYLAVLTDADLTDANCTGAILYGANLKGANLQGANLSGASLVRARLMGTNLAGAKFDAMTELPDAKFIKYDENRKPIYDKHWTPDTDMTRYTDPNHPDFWQPDNRAKKPE